MNNVKSLINQQTGFHPWRDSDTSLKRLRCTKDDHFTHLLPQRDEDEFYKDTPIFTCKFSPQPSKDHLLALANEDGKLAIHNCENNERYGSQIHNNAIFDLAWMFDRLKLVTASGDHTSKLYDIGGGEIRAERVFCGHTRSVKTVAFRKDDSNVFATGGRDGDIITWDIRTNTSDFVGKADRTITHSHISKASTPSKSKKKFNTPAQSGVKSVTGLVFQDDNTLISCGAGDGVIKIWDLRKNYVTYKREAAPKSVIPYSGNTTKNGYSSLIIDSTGLKLYANCLDNTIYCYNIGTYNIEPVMRYIGHQNSTFYVKSSLCKNGDYLISGSSDENAYIWNTKRSQPLVKLAGHTAEVTCVAWCNRFDAIITCSDDMTHMIWKTGLEDLPDDWEINGRGRADILPLKNGSNCMFKRVHGGEIVSDTAKKLLVECKRCGKATTMSNVCNSCVNVKRKTTGELGNATKMFHSEFGPRRLFGGMQMEQSESLAEYLDENHDPLGDDDEPPKKVPKLMDTSPARSASVSTEQSSPGVLSEIDETEPRNKLAMVEITPKRTKIEHASSPTTNLPNYVVDGTAPHLNYSPPKKKTQDWLTKMRVEKQLRQEMFQRTVGQNSPKQTRSEVTPKKPKKNATPKSPLLRYFRVTNSSPKCEGLAGPKFQNCNYAAAQWSNSDK